ncbi:hypothetical protein FDC50_10355 [Clostridium botulinum]|uniref:hypothetical protein n=1 Tax=unclassified Clostridium TaxID=2614128 RepID=UPI000506CC41|nr:MULTISPECIES: hypothetical protein [unclassified Clostridium]AIY79150.1 hypothetical protein U728_797 [Clostridium botulinum 202F]KAI3345107.1 hypothetical protein CIT17_14325 [Clostridium botulinum]KFX56120.1 hypothetical protein KU41_17220 [Clostridium botulinum]KFX56648.1 hypothetical protein KU40_08020 [Clostridium botulinum]MBY6804309.1 hypothetical protein [Clostridium botulinum]
MAVVKPVSFKNKEHDLVEFIGERDFSYYVKNLIRKDMEQQESKIGQIKPKKKRNINFDI